MSEAYPYHENYSGSHPYPQGQAPAPQPHACTGRGMSAPGAGEHDAQRTYDGQQAYDSYHAGEYGYPPAGYGYPAEAPGTGVGSWFEFSNSGYVKGFLLGAGVTLLLTNDAVQKALVRGTVKVWSLFQGGVEEVKEQFRDIKAEMSQDQDA